VRNEILIRGEKCKTRLNRTIPVSTRLRAVLELIRHDPAGDRLPPHAYVFGSEVGEQIRCIRRAWGTAVLKAHGHAPT
jgi:integrase